MLSKWVILVLGILIILFATNIAIFLNSCSFNEVTISDAWDIRFVGILVGMLGLCYFYKDMK